MNNPEYCQGIYDAAKRVVDAYNNGEKVREHEKELWDAIIDLERALDGKDTTP